MSFRRARSARSTGGGDSSGAAHSSCPSDTSDAAGPGSGVARLGWATRAREAAENPSVTGLCPVTFWGTVRKFRPDLWSLFRTESSAWSCQSWMMSRCWGEVSTHLQSTRAWISLPFAPIQSQAASIRASEYRPMSPCGANSAAKCQSSSRYPIAYGRRTPNRSARSYVFGWSGVLRFKASLPSYEKKMKGVAGVRRPPSRGSPFVQRPRERPAGLQLTCASGL